MAKIPSISAIASLAVSELAAKPKRAQKAAEQYIQTVFKEIQYGYYVLSTAQQFSKNQIPFSLSRVRHQLGRYSKKNLYWWDWLHQRFPLVTVISTGNSKQGVLSVIEPNIPLEIILASGNGKDLVNTLYSAADQDSELHFAPINLYSLENYILATTAENNPNPTIRKNLQDARTILMVARECDSKLPMIVNHSLFGRTYYKGLNLQNVHKSVRHAALGACYSVDINSAVFNWKYTWVPFQTELTYTRELIQDKNRIRRRLAQVVFGNENDYSIKTIKQVLTAISFGAKLNKKGYYLNPSWTPQNGEPKYITSSIDLMIKSPQLRQHLFEDSWMQEFIAEQDRINQHIGDELVVAATSGEIPEKYLQELRSERGRISRGKLIAWAYQQSEQKVMQSILKWSRAEVLLQIHDGVYFKSKPDMPSMQTVLRESWPIASLSIEEIDNYHYRNRVLDQEHLKFIRAEELKANNCVDPRTTGIHTENLAAKKFDTHSEPNWESVMWQEYLEHFPQPDPNMPEFAKRRLGV